jgi:hypothetical protein
MQEQKKSMERVPPVERDLEGRSWRGVELDSKNAPSSEAEGACRWRRRSGDLAVVFQPNARGCTPDIISEE